MANSEQLKGNLQTIILKLLSDSDKMYGYEITQKVRDLSEGQMLLTEGALYPTLHKLEAEGMVKTETRMIGKRMRKYYRLTKSGHLSVQEKIEDFKEFIDIMGKVLKIRLMQA